MSLGKRVKQLRKKKGINQKQLADASGITQATISRLESDQVKRLLSDALTPLADALSVPVDYLVGRTDELSPEDVFSSDPDAKHLLRGYEKLSSEHRQQLRRFINFLEEQQHEEEAS